MHDRNLLAPWVKRFLLEYLVAERNLARNTQFSYRDTLTLLLPFVGRRAGLAIDRLSVEDISPDTVRAFLEYVEHERGCGVVTRNQRLSAIHSLARFIGTRSPEHLAWCTEVRSIPFQKAAKTVIGYLEKLEMEALLIFRNQIKRSTIGPGNCFGREQYFFQQAVEIAFIGKGCANVVELLQTLEEIL